MDIYAIAIPIIYLLYDSICRTQHDTNNTNTRPLLQCIGYTLQRNSSPLLELKTLLSSSYTDNECMIYIIKIIHSIAKIQSSGGIGSIGSIGINGGSGGGYCMMSLICEELNMLEIIENLQVELWVYI